MKNVFIIAEAGVNHNGSLKNALKLIEAAKASGADAVKFQTFVPELVISRHAAKADYQQKNTGSQESQLDMVRKLYLDLDAHHQLIRHCREQGIEFLSTPFDLQSIDTLQSLGLHTFKIPSGEITNVPYLKKLGKMNERIILSTGMCYLEEVGKAIDVLLSAGSEKNKLALLHCNTEYPTPMEDVNLRAMDTMRRAFNVEVGYSDHTLGIEVPVAAVALGATIIEKHFTLDKTMDGPDHKASLEPGELKMMVASIRNIERAMGDGIKKPSPSETKNISVARKSIHMAGNLPKGHIIADSDLVMKRPGNGVSSYELDEIIGKKLAVEVSEDDMFQWSFIEK